MSQEQGIQHPKDVILTYKNDPTKQVTLQELLENHNKWLEEINEGSIKNGVRLNFNHFNEIHINSVNLSGLDLSLAIFVGAKISKSNLSEANLINTNFSGAELIEMNLSKANLFYANLSGTKMWGSNLSEANLSAANLSGANLINVNLFDTDLLYTNLSGAIINQATIDLSQNIKNGGTAINGIFTRSANGGYDSAALLPLNPKADSKYGRNVDVVVENLKHAQHLTGVYLTMVGVAFINLLVKSGLMNGKNLSSLPIVGTFVNLDVPLIFNLSFLMMVVLMMIGLPLKKAYEGAKYLRTRDEISKVGNFAWTMTQYINTESDKWERFISYAVRGLMIFSGPLVLSGLYYAKYIPQFSLKGLQFVWMFPSVLLYWIPIIVLGGLSIWLFRLTERFQKPLVFDPRQEHEDAEKAKNAKIDAENEQKLRMQAYQAMIDLAQKSPKDDSATP